MKKKNTYLVVLIVLLAISLGLMFVLSPKEETAQQERDYPEIHASGVINIVTEYNPVNYYVSDDTLAGMQYELCKYIAQQSGIEVNIMLENDLHTALEGLLSGKYDIVANNIPRTNDNRYLFNFTRPVKTNRQVLVQRRKDDENPDTYVGNQLELAHKTIHVSKGSPTILRLNNLSEEIAEPIVVQEAEEHTDEHLLYLVAYGEIDYAAIDYETARNSLPRFPEIDISVDISFNQFQAWAVRKTSPALLDSLNIWIENFLN
ncbi:transporter substrate-binding domain-containing protein [Bacteroidales bacterium OttesenSCG-928-J19]|nr:transporter substrate-binding domain-containing protein [Bacteroidales bacterium OttesenSCG-928-J19]